MDHIELPKNCNPLNITVPYLMTHDIEYDGQDFTTFPIRKGVDINTWDRPTLDKVEEKSSHCGVAFLQAWLYFGLLTEIFQDDYLLTDWTDGTEIYSSKLAAKLDTKKKRIQKLTVFDENGVDYSRVEAEENQISQLIRTTQDGARHVLPLESF